MERSLKEITEKIHKADEDSDHPAQAAVPLLQAEEQLDALVDRIEQTDIGPKRTRFYPSCTRNNSSVKPRQTLPRTFPYWRRWPDQEAKKRNCPVNTTSSLRFHRVRPSRSSPSFTMARNFAQKFRTRSLKRPQALRSKLIKATHQPGAGGRLLRQFPAHR